MDSWAISLLSTQPPLLYPMWDF